MLEKFKREMKKIIGTDIYKIDLIDDDVLLISDKEAAVRIERNISRMDLVEYAYYNPNKDGIVFALK